jgi:hypothetical protein
MALTTIPAFRLNRGDIIRHDNRRQYVRNVSHVVFYPRNTRNGELPTNGVRVTLRDLGGNRTEVTLKNEDTVRRYDGTGR